MKYKPNVLIVDDRPENLLSVEAILEPLDIVIHKASSADAALRCILDVEFAVVLLDVEMPEVDGFETARLIRSRQRTQNIPIIFLTAIDRGDRSVQKGYELGAVDFLVKPVQPDILRWKVSVFAELSRKSRQERQLFEEQIARAEADAFARRAGLLATASAALSSSLNEDAMLASLIEVLVPNWADCAVVYKAQHDQELQLDAFVHRDSSMDITRHPMCTYVAPLTARWAPTRPRS
jgi:CheY-like chemotaxis protein